MSKNQFTKTCYEVAKINRDIYYYLEYRKLPPKPNKKEILAITYEVGDLIDFSDDEEKDLIGFSNDKEKDLIDFSDDLIPQPQTKLKN